MKKEKTIRTYQRRTKTGKVVTVKQHTAKYDAAEALKEAAKKKGAGDELEASKKKGELDLAKIDAYKGDPNELSDKERQAWQILTGNFPSEAEPKLRKMKSLAKVWAYVDAKGKKKTTAKAPKEAKSSDSGVGFTADEYKAWYHWDQDADPKNKSALKVEKALKAKMGAKGYKKYFDEMSDSYSSRGHNRAFKALDAEVTVPKKDAKTPKSAKRESTTDSRVTSYLTEKGFKERRDGIWRHKDGREAWKGKDGNWVATGKMPGVRVALNDKFFASEKSVTPSKETKTSKIATPNSIEEIAKAGLKRVSVPSGKGDKKSAIYYTDGKQVYEPGEDGYLKKIAKNKMVPTARKLIDPPKSRASHKENSMGFSSLDWEATYGGGATGVDSDAAMHKIDKAARKYLGAKAYNKWAKYQDDSDDTGGSYKGFIKQLKRFKEGKDDWKSAPKNSGKYLAGKQKEGAEKEGLIYPKVSKSKTPRRGSKAAYEAAQKAKASLTSYIDASPYKRTLKSMNTYGGQVNKNELIGKLVKKGLSHAEASKIAGQFATKVKTEFTKSRQYRPGAK